MSERSDAPGGRMFTASPWRIAALVYLTAGALCAIVFAQGDFTFNGKESAVAAAVFGFLIGPMLIVACASPILVPLALIAVITGLRRRRAADTADPATRALAEPAGAGEPVATSLDDASREIFGR